MQKAALIIMRCYEYFISSLNRKTLHEMKFASCATEDIYMKEYFTFQCDDTFGIYENSLQTRELLLRRKNDF